MTDSANNTTTHYKGRVGLTQVIANLTEQHFVVCLPLAEHAPFDLVACKDGSSQTIQVRYRKLQPTGVIHVSFTSSWANSSGVHTKKMDRALVDVVAVYCPDTRECYYLDPKDFGVQMNLRVADRGVVKSKQYSTFHFAHDFVSLSFSGPVRVAGLNTPDLNVCA